MRPLLVDCADGRLEGEARLRVERHAGECGACGAALAALRDVAAALRQLPAPRHDEEFFRMQRQAIVRRVRKAPSPRPAPSFRPRFGWMAGLATAAVVALVLLRQPAETPVVLPPGAAIPGLSADDVADLADSAGLTDELLAFGEAPLAEGEEWSPEPDVHDLSDQELERLEEIIG